MLSKLPVVALLLALSSPVIAGPLHEAAKGGNTAEMQSILAGGADVNESDGIATPLYLAVAGNHVEAVKLLIAQGADVNLPAKFGTPASLAASGCNAEILKLLLDAGADRNSTWKSVALLHRAAEKGALDCVKLLVEGGADVNILTSGRTPPIHLAILRGHQDVADYLRGHGAHAPSVPPISEKLKTGDLNLGREIYVANCQKCHSADPAVQLHAGPNLWDVVGRAPGTFGDFKYSKSMKELGGTWDYEALNQFISVPAAA
ncbi:MAG TPA: ankyrin repeat domain-containing protein, partial [Terriglobales bacterium]